MPEGNITTSQMKKKLNQNTKLLLRKRREMSDKTAEEYRSINREIADEMKRFRTEKNQEEIKTVIENNKNLKVRGGRTEIGGKEIHKVKNKHGNIITDKKTDTTNYRRLLSKTVYV
ncbi:hypothetical protein HHI36_001517 [Cryptolaemus montrouzieri]|uniref:Uncharacterized protein n=1 Tax=Cryptolaemus montrouzieri TaxID=559131 RepID=A0ABD2P8N8_9CUCU